MLPSEARVRRCRPACRAPRPRRSLPCHCLRARGRHIPGHLEVCHEDAVRATSRPSSCPRRSVRRLAKSARRNGSCGKSATTLRVLSVGPPPSTPRPERYSNPGHRTVRRSSSRIAASPIDGPAEAPGGRSDRSCRAPGCGPERCPAWSSGPYDNGWRSRTSTQPQRAGAGGGEAAAFMLCQGPVGASAGWCVRWPPTRRGRTVERRRAEARGGDVARCWCSARRGARQAEEVATRRVGKYRQGPALSGY